MDEKRMGEIALAILRDRARRNSIRLGPDTKRELGDMAKKTNVPLDELKLFLKTLYGEAIEETLG